MESSTPKEEIFRLFDEKPPTPGLGFPEKIVPPPPPPPPPCLEVLASESEVSVSPSVKCCCEPVSIGGLTLLKGRVSTQEVFALANSDLVPGKYEGGLKLWEGSQDLITALSSEMLDGQLSFTGKRVLELGCGHGLPGIFACLKCLATDDNCETCFFSGDSGEVDCLLSCVFSNENEVQLDQTAGYDVILMAETVYSISALPNLYKLIKKCLRNPHGVVYMAAKKYYFGVGGGSRRFLSIVEKDGMLKLLES